MVPLLGLGASFSGSVDDENAQAISDPEQDLKSALDHKKGSVAADLALSVMMFF